MSRYYKKSVPPGTSKFYIYRPRGNLLKRIAQTIGISEAEAYAEIKNERYELLKELGYDVTPNQLL
jgi:hypothetical protein